MHTIIDLDPYIDVKKLMSLNMEIKAGIANCTATGNIEIFTPENVTEPAHMKFAELYNNLNDLTDPKYFPVLKELIPDMKQLVEFMSVLKSTDFETSAKKQFVGLAINNSICSQEIRIRETSVGYTTFPKDYQLVGQESTNEYKPAAKYFPKLCEYIENDLPLTEIGRVQIMFNNIGQQTAQHRDLIEEGVRVDMMWLCPEGNKAFWVQNDEGKKIYAPGYSVWFNNTSVHGTDAKPNASYSIRIDGKFPDEFAQEIGID
jgi:hypothetical protein